MRWAWAGRKRCEIDQRATGRPLALLRVSVFCGIPSIVLLEMQMGNLFGRLPVGSECVREHLYTGEHLGAKAVCGGIWMGIAKISM